MKHQSKLSQTEQQQQGAEQRVESQVARDFATPEELLRFDAAHTQVPPGIAQRLQQSIGPIPTPARPWWRRFFGGSQR